jgi:hypothetical protein
VKRASLIEVYRFFAFERFRSHPSPASQFRAKLRSLEKMPGNHVRYSFRAAFAFIADQLAQDLVLGGDHHQEQLISRQCKPPAHPRFAGARQSAAHLYAVKKELRPPRLMAKVW